jgi:hypothetical protein
MKPNINKYRDLIIITILVVAIGISCKIQQSNPLKANMTASSLETSFLTPPDTIQTSVYWYWMSDNISKKGVIKDLEAMKSVGINRAFIGNIGYKSTAYGKVKLFSEEWWDILHTALKTATALHIEIGIFNSPGWSQSGGPWVKPAQSMRYLAGSEVCVAGGRQLSLDLIKPNAEFQDVRVVAFKQPKDYGTNLADLAPKLSVNPKSIQAIASLIDRDTLTGITITDTNEVHIDFQTEKEFTARSLVIYPAHYTMTATAKFQALENGVYRTLKSFDIDRRKKELNVGFNPFAPIVISFPATTSKAYRLVLKKSILANRSFPKYGLQEIMISSSPRIERYIEKTFAKMFQAPLPYWNEYQWEPQSTDSDLNLFIDPKQVLDISRFMSATGRLDWNAPAGDWVIMRMGMTPTGVTNSPASPEGTGLEIDKMSKAHVKTHFDAFLGEIMRRIPAQDRKSWKVAVQDSYETGGQNWTDGLIDKFKSNYGYDPLPFLPTLKGKVIGNAAVSDRFLWDLRRFIADRVAYDYVGGLKEISNKHGLSTWLENYGHWGFPGEFLQYGGQSDEIGGEFWGEGELGNIENRAASSAAHIYGKTKVSAESFTAGGKPYIRYPGSVKQRGDRFFTEGVNNTLLHVYIQQPDEGKVPGISANFNMEFNRHNTWFSYLDLFISYLKRCNFMLQQGKYVADVAYFIGEDTPKMTGVTDPALPAGYSFDYINAEVLKNRATVKNGRIYLPDGMNYGLLVLPKLETMRPELLEKILELVKQGATVMGPAPKRSPSLQGFPEADHRVATMSKALWGNTNGGNITSHAFGKGRMIFGSPIQNTLLQLNILPDFRSTGADSLLFIHRTSSDAEIYYVSNQKRKSIAFDAHFRIGGKQPELWDPNTGKIRKLPTFKMTGGLTSVPLSLDKLESVFVVFRNPTSSTGGSGSNYPEETVLSTIYKPWEVTFDKKMCGPDQPVIFEKLIDWSESKDDRIKYYSGTAIYRNQIIAPQMSSAAHYFLNLGEVKVIAKVKINGIEVGGAWTSPWRVEITKALKKGVNKIEISVANTWVNRLIGDSALPLEQRMTWTNENPYQSTSPLEHGGLKGPVSISRIPSAKAVR